MKQIDTIKSALRRLRLSESEQSVYLSLVTEGQASARTIAGRTSITRPSVYDQIKSLQKIGLVHEVEADGKAQFGAADLKHLEGLLDDQIDRLEQSRDFLKTTLPSLRDSFKTIDPKVRFFEGGEGVKQLLKDIMWHDNETVSVIWNSDAMDEVYEETFLKWFDERRTARNLTVHSLWPKQVKMNRFKTLKTDKQRTISGSFPNMSMLIYGNKTAFISSPSEAFGYIIESAEQAELQGLQFDLLWKKTK